MRLNKSTSHAIRLLIECARAEGELVKVADLSARLGITMQNVFKIVHLLSRGGLIAAQRGRHGGVALSRGADEIAIGDIVRAMEATEIEVAMDGAATGASGRAVKGVNRVLDDALEAFIGVLDQHTLADMAGRPAARAPKPAAPRRRSPPTRAGRTSGRTRVVS
jgi:Rrf2 family nitric oxide-sensitive transcriptional repressor